MSLPSSSSLPPSSRSYEGQLLCFKPRYGWGWCYGWNDHTHFDYARVDEAGAFHIRVHHFFSSRGELRGFIGRVEQLGHLFDGLWAVTWTLNVGEYNFTDKLCHRWDIELGTVEPNGDDWPVMPSGKLACIGYGVVAVSSEIAQHGASPK